MRKKYKSSDEGNLIEISRSISKVYLYQTDNKNKTTVFRYIQKYQIDIAQILLSAFR